MKNKQKSSAKHIFIRNDVHARVKELSKKEGKKIQYLVNELLDAGIEYKKFLSQR